MTSSHLSIEQQALFALIQALDVPELIDEPLSPSSLFGRIAFQEFSGAQDMRQLLMGITMIVVVGVATPVVAQSSERGAAANTARGDGGVTGSEMATRIEQLQERVRTGVRTGAITRQEAAGLRQQIRQLYQLESQYSGNGFTRQESADLQDEYRDVRQQVRIAEAGSQYDRDEGAADTARTDSEPARRTGIDGLIDRVTGEPRPR